MGVPRGECGESEIRVCRRLIFRRIDSENLRWSRLFRQLIGRFKVDSMGRPT